MEEDRTISQIKHSLLEPRDYVLSPQNIQDFTCIICADLITHPVRCTVCKIMVCIGCASTWRASNDSCPKRCQQPWKFQRIESLHLQLRCPFGADCGVLYPENFREHILNCSQAPKWLRDETKFKTEFLCRNSHRLEFWSSTYENLTNSECSNCHKVGVCRAICRPCDELYCVECRFPPCSKKECSFGHSFEPFPVITEGCVCDRCGLRPFYFNVGIFEDCDCNLSFCELCYNQLPDVCSTQALENQWEQCSVSHALSYRTQLQPQKCDWCQKQKRCIKRCDKCNTHFCSSCKPPRLTYEGKCWRFSHSLKENDELVECTYCSNVRSCLFDEKCGFYLCRSCNRQLISIEEDKDRIVQHCCDHGHSLVEDTDLPNLSCGSCGISKYCSLMCDECDPYVYFCFQCRPHNRKNYDYVGHPLTTSTEPEICIGCQEKYSGMKGCQKCRYFLCETCVENYGLT